MTNLENSLLLKAYRGEKTSRPPIWFMRQAGRYLPEYLEVRKNYTINEVINNSELACEVTLQPLRRFNFDGSIIFADLLTPFAGIGIDFDFIKDEGPKVFNPIKSEREIEFLQEFDLASVEPTLKAINLVSKEINPKNLPLIGFAGAPFTLSSYLIEAQSNPKLNLTKTFFYNYENAWHSLQEKLVAMVVEYLLAQVKAGASAVQIFDSWLGGLSPNQYSKYVHPYLKEIVRQLKAKTSVPIIFFATGISSLYSQIKTLEFDCIGVDWRIELDVANTLLDNKFVLQGNLDPLALFAPKENLKNEINSILDRSKYLKSFVFNLGHGILPKTPIENVEYAIEVIQN